jgi:outer membrane murein-binding lipoprotein Lpp
MKKFAVVIAAIFAVALLAGCTSSHKSGSMSSTKMTKMHKDHKGEKDYKGELHKK